MTDIVERLREWALGKNGMPLTWDNQRLCLLEAADEIERLRKEADVGCYKIAQAELEIERLRAKLAKYEVCNVSKCEQCGMPLEGHRLDAAFCSNACRQKAYRERLGQERGTTAGLVGLKKQFQTTGGK